MASKPLGIWPSLLLGTFVGSLFFVGGYLLTVGKQESFGAVMFLLVPVVSGFAIAAVVRNTSLLVACAILTCILTLAMFISVGWEGYICCLMATPLLLFGIVLGAVFGYLVRGQFLDHSEHQRRDTTMLLAACPLILLTADHFERPFRSVEQHETFVSQIEVAATPEETWQHLVQMPSMTGTKPFLLRIGLPVPDYCTLDGQAVGARRVCYFNQGLIEQDVTEWQPPSRLTVNTTQSTLPGRHWLTFIDAGYELKPTAAGTIIERRSTIGTRLYPRWYWRPFEAWGVESEHEFVLTSIKNAVESGNEPNRSGADLTSAPQIPGARSPAQ